MTTKKVTIKKIKTKEDIITDKVDAIRNTLLGSYDDDGNYFISDQIVDELNRLTKVKKTVFNNSIFCVSNKLGYGEIVFEITFEKNTKENVAIAKLYVLESVYKVNGYIQNTIKTQIEEFKSTIDNFINKSYDYYKVVIDPNEDEGRERKDITDEIFSDSFILAKKQYSLAMDKLTRDKYNDIYAKLFARRIEVLKQAKNEFSTAVLEHFNEEFGLIEEHFLVDKNYKALNDLLDNSVEFLSGTDPVFEEQEREIEEELALAYEEFEEEAEKIEDKFEFKAFSLLSKKDKEILKEIKKEETSQYKQVNKELGEAEIEVEVEAETQTEEKVVPPVIDENLVQLTAKNAEDQQVQKVENPVQDKEETNIEKEETTERIVDEKLINTVKSNNEIEGKEEVEVIDDIDEKTTDDLQLADTDEKTDSLRDEIERITKEAHDEVVKDDVEKEDIEKVDIIKEDVPTEDISKEDIAKESLDEKETVSDEREDDTITDDKPLDDKSVVEKDDKSAVVKDDKSVVEKDDKSAVVKDDKSGVEFERGTPYRAERVTVVKTFDTPVAENSGTEPVRDDKVLVNGDETTDEQESVRVPESSDPFSKLDESLSTPGVSNTGPEDTRGKGEGPTTTPKDLIKEYIGTQGAFYKSFKKGQIDKYDYKGSNVYPDLTSVDVNSYNNQESEAERDLIKDLSRQNFGNNSGSEYKNHLPEGFEVDNHKEDSNSEVVNVEINEAEFNQDNVLLEVENGNQIPSDMDILNKENDGM